MTRFRLIPAWQLVTFPAVPVYWRATHRRGAALEPARIIHGPRRRADRLVHPDREAFTLRGGIPQAVRDEVVQRLLVRSGRQLAGCPSPPRSRR
ncbi:hypothetical protein Vau01_096880 [Virgisporangium aurantiacum]|uniref:Uncharacterized protein n=1 Tax=Virgisporangium aurantiacum TaxID=175570 RepID=A0A8J4E7W0_9ACTN|nr:hypothetical protein Vau01_096880 [Virgisporangium aurantiacum]